MAYNSKEKVSVDDVVLSGVLAIMNSKQNSNKWIGTMTDISSAITNVMGKKVKKSLPGSPSAMRIVLNRILNRVRSRGIGVKFGRTTDRTRTRFVKFTR